MVIDFFLNSNYPSLTTTTTTNINNNNNHLPIHLSINNIHAGFNGDHTDSVTGYSHSASHNRPLFCAPPNAESRHRSRVNQARDKILHGAREKANLNKMTILQPFEDTKILINIDNVSSKILNSLLNKTKTNTPRYYMPPIRSYGYFKRVAANVPDDVEHRAISAKRPLSKARAKFNL